MSALRIEKRIEHKIWPKINHPHIASGKGDVGTHEDEQLIITEARGENVTRVKEKKIPER